MNGLHLYYKTSPTSPPIEWPTIYQPSLTLVDEFSLGASYIQWPFMNGVEHIYAFLWEDDNGHLVHHWTAEGGWMVGGPE